MGTTLESKNQLYCASQRAQLTQRLEIDPTGKSPLGLDVGLTLEGRSEKHPSGPCVPAKKPRKGLSCASAEVFLNKYQPGSSLIHSFTIRLQTHAVGLLKQCQSQQQEGVEGGIEPQTIAYLLLFFFFKYHWCSDFFASGAADWWLILLT